MNPLAGEAPASIDAMASTTCRWHRALFLLPMHEGLHAVVTVISRDCWWPRRVRGRGEATIPATGAFSHSSDFAAHFAIFSFSILHSVRRPSKCISKRTTAMTVHNKTGKIHARSAQHNGENICSSRADTDNVGCSL